MKKLAAALLTAMAMAVAPVATSPVAQADICAGAPGLLTWLSNWCAVGGGI